MVSQDSFQTARKILNYFVKLHKFFGSVNIESGQEDKKFALIRKLNEIFPYWKKKLRRKTKIETPQICIMNYWLLLVLISWGQWPWWCCGGKDFCNIWLCTVRERISGEVTVDILHLSHIWNHKESTMWTKDSKQQIWPTLSISGVRLSVACFGIYGTVR